MESYFTNTTRFSPPPLSLALPRPTLLPLTSFRSLSLPLAPNRSPSLCLALLCYLSLSLALPCPPSRSFALPRSPVRSLAFPRFPSISLALPCSIFYSYAHAHSHTLTPYSQTRDHLGDGLQMSVILPNVTPSHPSCLSHITPSHSSCLLHPNTRAAPPYLQKSISLPHVTASHSSCLPHPCTRTVHLYLPRYQGTSRVRVRACVRERDSLGRRRTSTTCCSVLQRVAACCSVLQCVAECCCALQRVAVRCCALPCGAVSPPMSAWRPFRTHFAVCVNGLLIRGHLPQIKARSLNVLLCVGELP